MTDKVEAVLKEELSAACSLIAAGDNERKVLLIGVVFEGDQQRTTSFSLGDFNDSDQLEATHCALNEISAWIESFINDRAEGRQL